jgi:diguanylate cyclase (GGDEF)-like protein
METTGNVPGRSMKKLRRILVVDNSRVVRATLAKHLKETFEIREEANDESAWQTLVLDASIVAVISSMNAPKLEAQGLLQRLRDNPLPRLKNLPFLLIASETGKHAGQGAAMPPGVAGFITKAMPKTEIIERLQAVLDPCSTIECRGLPELREEALPALLMPDASTPALLSREDIERRIAHTMSTANRQSTGVSALIFGIVNHDALIDQFGEEVAEEIGARFANLLLAKIGRHDSIARYPGERLLIVSRGIGLAQCVHFARRVCKSLASGHITIRGQQVKLSATAGAATSLEKGVSSSASLLALASQRLDRALGCGGNAVVTDSRPDCPLHNAGLLLPNLLTALNANGEQAIAAQIGSLGLQVMPLIKALNQEFSLGLQLPDLKRQLQQRADTEQREASLKRDGEKLFD